MKHTFRLVVLGLFIAQSLVLYIVEGLLPVPFIAPGAKLGLANLITVIALYTLPRKKDVAIILGVRLMLAAGLGGGINAFWYSLAGAVLSFSAMVLLQKTGKFGIFGISAAGGFFHNLGQVIVASCIVENMKVMLYLPILAVAGIGTGILLGITSWYTLKHLKKLPLYQRLKSI